MVDSPTDVLSMGVEILFIPPQRSIEVVNELQDTIGVVGQARQKQRRPKASPWCRIRGYFRKAKVTFEVM